MLSPLERNAEKLGDVSPWCVDGATFKNESL